MTHKARTKKRGTRIGAMVAAVVVAITMTGATAAHADDADWLTGNLSCTVVPLIGTESTAKGTKIEHALAKWGQNVATYRYNVGSSTVYAPWGFSFPGLSKVGIFYVFASGSGGAIKAGSLKRFCTTW